MVSLVAGLIYNGVHHKFVKLSLPSVFTSLERILFSVEACVSAESNNELDVMQVWPNHAIEISRL